MQDRAILDMYERKALEAGRQLSPGSAQAALRTLVPDKELVQQIEKKDRAVATLCDILDQFAPNDPQKAWEALNSLRILYEFRHHLPLYTLSIEPRLLMKPGV